MARRRNKGQEKRIARTRIQRLLGSAREEAVGPDADLADRQVELAAKIAKRYQIPLGRQDKVRLCRGCHAYRRADTSRTRVRSGKLVTTCLACGKVTRRPLAVRREETETT